jgi:hypothetical protein
MICFTLRRSMLSSRANARWLRPSACQPRTACSSDDTVGTADGSAWSAGGAEWFGVDWMSDVKGCSALSLDEQHEKFEAAD